MFVFGSLRPGGDEVGEFESPGRWPALADHAGLAADVLPHDFPLLEILADVIEVEVNRRRVAARGPFLGWRIKGDVGFRSVQGIPFYEGAQGFIHVLDHRHLGSPPRPAPASRPGAVVRVKLLPEWAVRSASRRPFGHPGLPIHWPARPLWHTGHNATLAAFLTALNQEEIAHAQLFVARCICRGGGGRLPPN